MNFRSLRSSSLCQSYERTSDESSSCWFRKVLVLYMQYQTSLLRSLTSVPLTPVVCRIVPRRVDRVETSLVER